MATVNSSSSGGVIGSGCEVPRSSDRSSVVLPSSNPSSSGPSDRRDTKFAHNSSPSPASSPGTEPSAGLGVTPTSDYHPGLQTAAQDSASSNQQTVEEKLDRMNVDEFQAFLEACTNKSKIITQEHAAMFSQLEHPTKVSPEEQIPSLTNAKYSSSLQSINQAQHPPSSSSSSRGSKGPSSTSYSSQNSTPKAGGSSGGWSSSSGGPHAAHNNNYHPHPPHLSSKSSSSNFSNCSSTSLSCSAGDQNAQPPAHSQSLHSSSNSVTLSLHNSRDDPNSASPSQTDESRCSGSSSSSTDSPCSTTFTAQAPTSFHHNHNTSPSSTSSSVSSMSSVSSVNVNYNFNLKRPTPKPQIENHTEITATATLPSPYFFNIRNEENDTDGRIRVRNRVIKDEDVNAFSPGELAPNTHFLRETAANLQLRNEYPSVNSITNTDFSASFGLTRNKEKDVPSTPPCISEPATATLNITRTAPPRTGLDERFERKKAARNNKNKKRETIMDASQVANYVGDKYLKIDEILSFVGDDSGEAAGSASSSNKLKKANKKARRREALSKSHSLDENTLGLELNPAIEARSVSSTLVDKESDVEESTPQQHTSAQSKVQKKPETLVADSKSVSKDVEKVTESERGVVKGTQLESVKGSSQERVKFSPPEATKGSQAPTPIPDAKPAPKVTESEKGSVKGSHVEPIKGPEKSKRPQTPTHLPELKPVSKAVEKVAELEKTSQPEAIKSSLPERTRVSQQELNNKGPTPEATKPELKAAHQESFKEVRSEPSREAQAEPHKNTHQQQAESLFGDRKSEAGPKYPIRPAGAEKSRFEPTNSSRPRLESFPSLTSGANSSTEFITVTNRKKNKIQKPPPPPPRSNSQGQGLGKPPVKAPVPQRLVPSTSSSQPFTKGPSKPGPASFPGSSRPPLQLQLSVPLPPKSQINGASPVPLKTEKESVDTKSTESQDVSVSTLGPTPSPIHLSQLPPPTPLLVHDTFQAEQRADRSEVPSEPQAHSSNSDYVLEDEEGAVELNEDGPEAVKFCGVNFEHQPLPKADYEFGFGINEVLHDNSPVKLSPHCETPIQVHILQHQFEDLKLTGDHQAYTQGNYPGPPPGHSQNQSSKQVHGEREGLLGRHPQAVVSPPSQHHQQQPGQQPHQHQTHHIPQQQFNPIQHQQQVSHHQQQLGHPQQLQQQQQQQLISGYPLHQMAASQFATFYPNYPQLGFPYYANNPQATPPPQHLSMNPTPPPPPAQMHQINVPPNPQLIQLGHNAHQTYNYPPPNFQQVAAVLNTNVVPGHPPPQSHLYVQTSNASQGAFMKTLPSPTMFQPYQLAGVGQQFNSVYQQQQHQYMAALSSSGAVVIPQIQFQQNPNSLASPNQVLIQSHPNPIPQTQQQQQLYAMPPPQQQQTQLFTSVPPPPMQHPGRRPANIQSPSSIPPPHLAPQFYPQVHCVQQPTLSLPVGAPTNFIMPTGTLIYKPAESPNDVNGNSNSNVSDRETTRGGGRGRRGRGGTNHMDGQGRGGPRQSTTNYRRPEPGSLPALMERSVHRHTGPYQQPRPELYQRRDSKSSISPVTSPPMPTTQKYVEDCNHYYAQMMLHQAHHPPQHGYDGSDHYRNRGPANFMPGLIEMPQQSQYLSRSAKERNPTPKSSDSVSEVSATTPSPQTVSRDTSQSMSGDQTSDAQEPDSPTTQNGTMPEIGTAAGNPRVLRPFNQATPNYSSTETPASGPCLYMVVDAQHPLENFYVPPSQNDQNDAQAEMGVEFMNKYVRVVQDKIDNGATVLRL